MDTTVEQWEARVGVPASETAWHMYSEAELMQALLRLGVREGHVAFLRDPVLTRQSLWQGVQQLASYASTAVHEIAVEIWFRYRGRFS